MVLSTTKVLNGPNNTQKPHVSKLTFDLKRGAITTLHQYSGGDLQSSTFYFKSHGQIELLIKELEVLRLKMLKIRDLRPEKEDKRRGF